MTRVLIADDSAVAREVLARVIQDDPEMLVVGSASSGEETIRKAQSLKPDLITMDFLMPDMDGVEATRRIMAVTPTPIVVVSSTVSSALSATHFDALAAGAVDVVEKPDLSALRLDPTLASRFVENLKAMSQVVTLTRRRRSSELPPPLDGVRVRAPAASPARPSREAPGHARLMVMGASTGGPQIIPRVLELLDKNSPPLVLVQHMAEGFIGGYVDWLNQNLAVDVRLAQAGARIEPGTVYVAPDGRHVEVSSFGRLLVYEAPPLRYHRPSVDILLQSAASQFAGDAVGVLLTGMGDDGARGLAAMHQAGAFTIAQNKETSLIYGMPAAAVERGGVSLSASPEAIAQTLRTIRAAQQKALGSNS